MLMIQKNVDGFRRVQTRSYWYSLTPTGWVERSRPIGLYAVAVHHVWTSPKRKYESEKVHIRLTIPASVWRNSDHLRSLLSDFVGFQFDTDNGSFDSGDNFVLTSTASF